VEGEKMAEDHRRSAEKVLQGVLLDEPNFLRQIVERVLQEMLEAEMTEHIGAAPYERSEKRTGQRNGYKPRALRTRVGTLNLLVPQDREGTFSTRLFSRYQRNEKALVLALMEMYVEGISTRSMMLGVLLLGGVALADTIDGTSGADDLVGTDKDDVIHASGGADYLSGLAAPDVLYAGAGNDTVVGREGNDRIYGNTGSDELFGAEGNDTIDSAGDGEMDVVKCGQGDADTAYVDKIDWVKKNCENVFLLVREERPVEKA
jgi:hypothetical protein